jgi:hypothetical protein
MSVVCDQLPAEVPDLALELIRRTKSEDIVTYSQVLFHDGTLLH